jgi:quercetin dioxygenase-like cupin family protein
MVQPGVSTARIVRDSDERFIALRHQLGVSSFGINLITLAPGQRMRIHRHAHQEEIYLVLEGTLTLLIEGEAQQHGADELIRVAPQVRRQLVNRGPGRLVLLALGGAGEHESRDGEAFADWSQQTGAPPQQVPLPEDLDLSA